MTRLWMTGTLAWLIAWGTAFAQPEAPAQNSVKLAAVILDIPAGTPWLSLKRGGLVCIYDGVTKTSDGSRAKQDVSAYAPTFKLELEGSGYKVVTPGEDNLFDPQAASSDYQAAAVISDARIDGCISDGGMFSQAGSIRGKSFLKIDWQIYSPLKKQVVARVSTSGMGSLDTPTQGGYQQLLMEAFDRNVRALGQNPDFRAAMIAPKGSTKGVVEPGQQSKILLAGSLKAPAQHIEDAVGSVVMLQTSTGSGSGILVSEDGYVLTNAHVVGDEKTIRVRWSDKIETVGEVVRVAGDRDVALVKTNPRERTPLALKRGAVSPGQRVYAIGTPRDKAFQNTVSSGVISGNRIIDGLRFIQSDVSISPGSSGGALLDEKGSVIGIAVSHYLNGGQPAGLNMFIPIGDAMDFLSLEQH